MKITTVCEKVGEIKPFRSFIFWGATKLPVRKMDNKCLVLKT